MEYAYIRVSTKEQNTDRQIEAILKRGIIEKNIFTDKQSGKDFNRPNYKKMYRKLKKGDLVVISSIDRLGRNYQEILEQWRLITKVKEADIEVLDMPLLNTRVKDDNLTGVFIADLVLQILAYVAETERAFIRKRQAEGIAVAKAKGVKFGRTTKPVPDDFAIYYEKWKRHELSSREAARLCGMPHSTFYKKCREFHI